MGIVKCIDRALSRWSGMNVKAEAARGVYPYGLQDPVLTMGGTPIVHGDLYEHIFVCGGTGSGKSSAILPVFIRTYLQYGYGGFVCTVKSDDTERMLRLCAATGRLDDVILVNPSQGWHFSFLDHELTREGRGAGSVENAVALFLEVINNRAAGGKREEKDSFWSEGVRRLLRHSMEAIRLAGYPVTMQRIASVIHGMPVAGADGRPVSPPDSFLVACMGRAEAAGHSVEHLQRYFFSEMARPGTNRMVSSVVATFTNMADPFLSGPVASLFANEAGSNWTPDLTRFGKICILDLPTAEYGEVGRTAQILMKKVFIDALLRRQGLPRGEVPVFMLCDEYQALATGSDKILLQAGRSSYVSTLCATQNLNNLYATFDGIRAKYEAHAMLGNFSTLIGCRNHDVETNQWFADTIAKTLVMRRNQSASWGETTGSGGHVGYNAGHSSSQQGGSWSHGASGGHNWQSGTSFNGSAGVSEQFEYPVAPGVFTQLAAGGPSSRYQVQAIVFKAGKRFEPHGMPYTGQIFRQRST